MQVPKKTLTIWSEPDAESYSCGKFPISSKESENNCRKLIKSLGLEGRVREVLAIFTNCKIPYAKTFDGEFKIEENSDVRTKPYSASTFDLEKGEGTLTPPLDKEELLEKIFIYLDRNMDYKTLAIVKPELIDFLYFATKDICNIETLPFQQFDYKEQDEK